MSRFRKAAVAAKKWVSRKTAMHSVHSRVSSMGWLQVIGRREGIMSRGNLFGSRVVKLLHWFLYVFVIPTFTSGQCTQVPKATVAQGSSIIQHPECAREDARLRVSWPAFSKSAFTPASIRRTIAAVSQDGNREREANNQGAWGQCHLVST